MSIAKPPQVFDRELEWSALASFASSWEPELRMGVVSGRRRQGKTFLLQALAEACGGFYFTAAMLTSADALREFGVALAEHTRASAPYRLDDWDHALRILYEAVPDGLIVIDEFPYLVKAEPALPSLLQRALDPRGHARRSSNAKLLLCGSAMAVMGSLLSGNAPLRGRAGLELLVRPFDYRTSADFWGITDPRLAVLVHAVVGGTPAYRRAFVRGDAPRSIDDFDDWVIRTLLNPDVPIFREARYLLAEETDIREPLLYNSVLGAIAAGNTTRGGIANYIGRRDSDLVHPLNVLEDAGLVAREADPFHSRRSTYRVTEPLIVFYESIMQRRWTLLEQRHAAAVWADAKATFLSQVVGPQFEALCREFAVRPGTGLFDGLAGEVAAITVPDRPNRTRIEVDVAVLAPGLPGERRKVLSLGEAKWNKVMGLRHMERLRRARDLLVAKGVDAADAVLACYSGAGFDEALQAEARQDRHVALVDVARLYR